MTSIRLYFFCGRNQQKNTNIKHLKTSMLKPFAVTMNHVKVIYKSN